MTDFERLTLEAFLTALAKQSAPLPDEIQQQLNEIGANLEQHIDKLDAQNSPQFAPLPSNDRSDSQGVQPTSETPSTFKRYEEAIASFDQALQYKPDDAQTWNSRGIALMNISRYEEATGSFDQALQFKPNDPQTWINRGIALMHLGRHEDAIASHNQGVNHTPANHTTQKFTAPDSIPEPSPPSGIQRFVLAANASDRNRQNYQHYLEELQRLNPGWVIVPDRPQSNEAEAHLMIYQDKDYVVRHAAYIAACYLDDFCQNLSL